MTDKVGLPTRNFNACYRFNLKVYLLSVQMQTLKHIAVYINAAEQLQDIINIITQSDHFDFSTVLKEKNGEVFSAYTIQQFVKEELLHDQFDIIFKKAAY